jgi:hypothetical protein
MFRYKPSPPLTKILGERWGIAAEGAAILCYMQVSALPMCFPTRGAAWLAPAMGRLTHFGRKKFQKKASSLTASS